MKPSLGTASIRQFLFRALGSLAVLSGIGYLWLATAGELDAAPDARPTFTPEQVEAAKKHDDFATLAAAQKVMVAKIRVTVEGVAESFPPIYELRMVVVTTEGITDKVNEDELLQVRFSRRQEDEPKFDDVPYLVAIGTNEDADRLLLLKPADENLTKIARIAAFHGANQRNRNARLARDNPEMHPLFDELKTAKHIALLRLSSDLDAAVGFDVRERLEEHYDVQVIDALRGDMEPGVLKRLSFTEDATDFGTHNIFFAVVEYRNGKPVVTRTIPANEERIRVVAAVTETAPEGLLKAVSDIKAQQERDVGAARAREAVRGIADGIFGAFGGDSAGSSRSSEGSAETVPFDPEAGEAEVEEAIPER